MTKGWHAPNKSNVDMLLNARGFQSLYLSFMGRWVWLKPLHNYPRLSIMVAPRIGAKGESLKGYAIHITVVREKLEMFAPIRKIKKTYGWDRRILETVDRIETIAKRPQTEMSLNKELISAYEGY